MWSLSPCVCTGPITMTIDLKEYNVWRKIYGLVFTICENLFSQILILLVVIRITLFYTNLLCE